MTGHVRRFERLRRPAILATLVLASLLVAPGPLNAVDPTPAPSAGPEMLRLPEGSDGDPGGPAPLAPDPLAPEPLAPVIPSGFHESTIFSGLFLPTSIDFADDGRVFVAEKRGVVKMFDSVSDPTPTTFANLQVNVHDYWDRGMLGMTLDPNFETNGRVYVLYTYNHILGDAAPAPKWVNGTGQDICPNPPGSTTDGCVASARLSRLETGAGGVWDGTEHVLVEGWCQVHPSHSIGTVAFGPEGALYAGAGEASSFVVNADYGQDFGPTNDLTPDNPCGDPPSPVGTALAPPTAEGGALRSQDLQTLGDPVGLDGSIIRIDPLTGAAWPTNANIGHADVNARKIIANGLRNPFRFTFRPGTSEVWIGDVGAGTWEELNRLVSPTGAVQNYGWPCYEGPARKGSFDSLDLTICENLYTQGIARAPYYAYSHGQRVVAGDACPDGPFAGSVISGSAFYPTSGGPFPAAYDGAFFFADYARKCIWAMRAGAGGLPDTSQIEVLGSGLSGPVAIKIGPDGALYYVGFDDGTIHRITVSPSAVASGTPTSGPAPLLVQFDGSDSINPKGGPLLYAWDLDGDGAFDDSAAVNPSWTYLSDGGVTARLRVTDGDGAFDIADVPISVGNDAPVASITTPSSSLTWSVGDVISYSGSATDTEDGTEPGSRLAWSLSIRHCPDACHSHTIQSSTGLGGSFPAPNHEYPSNIEIRLVATDAHGATSDPVTVTLQPKTTTLELRSDPPGVGLTVSDAMHTAPFDTTVINKSQVQISAPLTAVIGGQPYDFAGWSDGGAADHSLTVTNATPPLVASYVPGTTYRPITPVRVFDSRALPAGPLIAGARRTYAVAGTNGIPASAIAITGNLTAVDPTRDGWIELGPSTGAAPTTSALNLPAGDTRANGVTVLLGDDGKLAATYRAPSGSTHLLLDITGYFVAANTGATFTPLGPTRLLDTRTGTGGFDSPFASKTPRTIQLGGVGGIPADAVAVSGNLTVTNQTAEGYVSMTTGTTTTPAVSTLNVPVGDTRANGLTIKLNGNGRASLIYVAGPAGVATADLLFDATGYYRSGTGGLRFYPVDPRRIFDTRAGDAPSLLAGSSRVIDVAGNATIPTTAEAVATNVTVVGQTADGYLSITTQATTNPATSTINFPLGDTRANNSLNALDSGGRMRGIYKALAGARTNLIVDLAGYFH